MRRTAEAWLAGILAALSWGQAGADEAATQLRALASRHQQALGILKGVVELKISLPNGQNHEQEVPVEFPALAIEGSEGFFVSANPENENSYQGNFRQIPGVQLDVSGKDYKLILSDGKENEVKIEGVDTEYNLAFLKLSKPAAAVKPTSLAAAKKLEMGDPFVILRLLSADRPETTADIHRVDYRFLKPAEMFRFVSVTTPPGSPAFDLEGAFIGLACVYNELRPGGGRVTHQVILPASRLKEIAANLKPAGGEGEKGGEGPAR